MTRDELLRILSFADRVYQLPLGLIGIAMGVVLLPDLSRRLSEKDEVGAMHSQNRALELSLLFTIPAAIALFVIPLVVPWYRPFKLQVDPDRADSKGVK